MIRGNPHSLLTFGQREGLHCDRGKTFIVRGGSIGKKLMKGAARTGSR